MDSRLWDIYLAAGRLFNTKRYRNTKVSEIAAAAGIATGTVYNLFANKKAILTFVIRASFELDFWNSEPSLPIAQAEVPTLISLFRQSMERYFGDIVDKQGKIACGFIELISRMYDMHADVLMATNNIEHNADLFPDLADAFFSFRKEGFVILEDAIARYMRTGEIRTMEYPRIHMQNINDISTWWAMNAYIAMPDVMVPRETGKKIAVDLLARAYLTQYI